MAQVLESYTGLATAPTGTRCYDRLWRSVRRVRGGWRYEESDAPGLFDNYEMTKHLPLQVIEHVQPEPAPPVPRVPPRVSGCVYWDAEHPSPWVTFSGITAYRAWGAELRRYIPGVKTEMVYTDYIHTAESLLRVAAEKAESTAEEDPVPE